jgi:hypothetical protein
MRTLATPKIAEPWSLNSLREKLIKMGAKVVSHGRYVTFELAEVAVPRQMVADVLSLIARLRAAPAPACGTLGQMQQTTTAEVCLDERKSSSFPRRKCSQPAEFECLLRTRCAMYRCPRRPKGRSWLTIHPESGESRLK